MTIITKVGPNGANGTSAAILRHHRELARAHPLNITGDTLLTPILIDEVHHQLYNDIFCAVLF